MEKTTKDVSEGSGQNALVSSSGSMKETEEVLKISGSADIEGGDIPRFVRISGSGRINGDLRCNGIKSSGSLKSEGSITSHGNVRSSGSFAISGGLQSDADAKFSGSAKVGQSATILGSIKSSGSFKIQGELDLGKDAKFSGSAKIGGETSVQGFTKSSGSLKIGKNLQAVNGITSSGSIGVNGNLLSQRDVKLKGAAGVEGNVVAENVEMGFTKWYSLRNLRIYTIRKHPYKIKGSIFAKNRVDVTRTLVNGDVKGLNVRIGRRSQVDGNVYFVNSVKIKRSAKISGEPIQVPQEELKL